MKPKFTNRMDFTSQTGLKKKALGLFMMIALGASSVTFAQQSVNGQNDLRSKQEQTTIGERTIAGATIKNSGTISAACPAITNLAMLDMGWDKIILTWTNVSNYDSIEFRYAPTGSPITRTESISGTNSPVRYNLLGLQSQTSYDIEVAGICGGVRGPWSAPITVVTLSEPAPRIANSNVNKLTITPNPASAHALIAFTSQVGIAQQVKITSSTGLVVFSRMIIPTAEKAELNVDVTNFPSGVYMVRVSNPAYVSVERLVKL